MKVSSLESDSLFSLFCCIVLHIGELNCTVLTMLFSLCTVKDVAKVGTSLWNNQVSDVMSNKIPESLKRIEHGCIMN